MIVVDGKKFITLNDDIYVDGKKVYEAYANGKKVYPDLDAIRGEDVPGAAEFELYYPMGVSFETKGLSYFHADWGDGESTTITGGLAYISQTISHFRKDASGVRYAQYGSGSYDSSYYLRLFNSFVDPNFMCCARVSVTELRAGRGEVRMATLRPPGVGLPEMAGMSYEDAMRSLGPYDEPVARYCNTLYQDWLVNGPQSIRNEMASRIFAWKTRPVPQTMRIVFANSGISGIYYRSNGNTGSVDTSGSLGFIFDSDSSGTYYLYPNGKAYDSDTPSVNHEIPDFWERYG